MLPLERLEMIARMSRALNRVTDLDDMMARLAAYADHDVQEIYILELDEKATQTQRVYRSITRAIKPAS